MTIDAKKGYLGKIGKLQTGLAARFRRLRPGYYRAQRQRGQYCAGFQRAPRRGPATLNSPHEPPGGARGK